MVKILIGCTGSVATIKLRELVEKLKDTVGADLQIRVVLTKSAQHFLTEDNTPKDVEMYTDEDEWAAWSKRGDPVLHIELGKWADMLLIAPLDANTMAKITNGICDNLLSCTVRAWELSKPLIFCPAMNTKMYEHPLTKQQIDQLVSWGYHQIPVISKTLMCGDTGQGAMAEVSTIVNTVSTFVNQQ